jgi:hypothetical protein
MTYPFAAIPPLASNERFIRRASLVDATTLTKTEQKQLPKPHVPILSLDLGGKIHQPNLGMGLVALDGCDILFFDVWQGRTCFSYLANPGDPDVVAAMTAWDKAGFMRVQLRGGGEMLVMRDEFTLSPVVKKAFKDSAEKPDFTAAFLSKFELMMEPGGIEGIVFGRTRRQPDAVNAGLVCTAHTEPNLPKFERRYH